MSGIRWSATLCLALVAAAGARAADEMPGDPQLAAAVALAGQKKYAEAAPALEKFVAAFPKHARVAEARVRWGDALLALAKPEEALKAYAPVLDLKPAMDDRDGQLVRAAAQLGSARALVALKNDAKALEFVTPAFAAAEFDDNLGPASGELLGEILFRLGRYADAARAYYRVTRWSEYASAPRAYYLVGESYRLAGSDADAAAAFQTTAEQHPRSTVAPTALLAAADAYLRMRKYEESEVAYRQTLRLYRDSAEAPRAQLGLGRVAFEQGQYTVARSAFQAAAVLFEKSVGAEAELRIADSYAAEKNLPEARTRYASLLASPNRIIAGEAGYTLAQTYLREGKPAPAADQFEKTGADRSGGRWSQLARLRLAELRAGAGDYPSAIVLLRTVLPEAAEPGIRDEASFRIGEALLKRGEFAAAEAELTGLVQRAPSGAYAESAQVYVATTRLEQKDAAGAAGRMIDLLKKELQPEARAGALVVLGKAQLQLKQEAAAVASLREVLDKLPLAAAAPEAARTLLFHYRDARLPAQATEIEKLISARYGAAGVASDGLLEQAGRQLQAGHYEEALGLYVQVLDRQPDRASRLKARAGAAEAAALLKKPGDAETHLQAIPADAPPPGFLAMAEYRVGLAHEKATDLPRALTALRAAQAAAPDADTAPGILLATARILSDQKKPEEAEPLLTQLLAQYSNSPLIPEALYALGWSYLDRGQAEAAQPAFGRLTTLYASHPLAADAAFRLGEWQYDAGRFPAAAQHYRKAAEGGGALAEKAGYKLGWALRQSKDHAGAAQAFVAAASRYPRSELARECRVRAGEEFLAQEQDKPALEQFQLVISQEGTTPLSRALGVQARLGAATALLLQGDFEHARPLAEEVATPANGWFGGKAQLVRAEAVYSKEGPKAAVSEFSRATTLYGRYKDVAAEALFRLGECYDKLKNARAAQAAWKRVQELYPGTEWATRSRERIDATSDNRAQR